MTEELTPRSGCVGIHGRDCGMPADGRSKLRGYRGSSQGKRENQMPSARVSSPKTQNISQTCRPVDQADAAVIKMFEQQRNEILEITNYIEALYARLLAASTGQANLNPVEDDSPSNPV